MEVTNVINADGKSTLLCRFFDSTCTNHSNQSNLVTIINLELHDGTRINTRINRYDVQIS